MGGAGGALLVAAGIGRELVLCTVHCVQVLCTGTGGCVVDLVNVCFALSVVLPKRLPRNKRSFCRLVL